MKLYDKSSKIAPGGPPGGCRRGGDTVTNPSSSCRWEESQWLGPTHLLLITINEQIEEDLTSSPRRILKSHLITPGPDQLASSLLTLFLNKYLFLSHSEFRSAFWSLPKPWHSQLIEYSWRSQSGPSFLQIYIYQVLLLNITSTWQPSEYSYFNSVYSFYLNEKYVKCIVLWMGLVSS